MRSISSCTAFCVAMIWPSLVAAIVVSEIHYHPIDGEEALEFIEVAADTATPEDISGYAFVGGISFEFPPGTILRGNSTLVVCADVDAVRERYGIENVLGNYSGRLDNGGERLTLVNHVGLEVFSMRYQDDGKWPVAPDGSGHSLVLARRDLDATEPESWTWSARLGGSPGNVNLAEAPDLRRGAIVFNELFRGTDSGEGWIEWFNPSDEALDLSGFRVSTGDPEIPPYVFPEGSSLAAGGFTVVDAGSLSMPLAAEEVRLFLATSDGDVLAAATYDREPPPGSSPGAFSEQLFPDGGTVRWVSTTPTRGAPNQVDAETRVVINEIFYHPPEERQGEFLELFNRGTEPVNLSGFRFSKGVRYTLPDGAVIPPGGYLVVAEDPMVILESHGYAEALGPYEGTLADAGENVRLVDRAGNLVDQVRYYDGGKWSRWADGGGASLELIDPTHENDFASAWDASDESTKASWQELSYVATGYVPTEDSELHIYAAERGECLIDDLRIVPVGGGANYAPNSGFEAPLDDWIIEGTHIDSGRVTSDAHDGEASLALVATGKGDELCNRLEVETSPGLAQGDYEVSFWARWQRGTSLLIVHGEPSAGLTGSLATDALGARLRMDVPLDLGTPGAENSVRRKLRETSGSDNLGPVIGAVRHTPVAPLPDTPPRIEAQVSDADGVTAVRVHYRTDDDETFATTDLFDDGAHADGRAMDGLYAGELPAFPRNTRVTFYVEAVDSAGASRFFPREAPDRDLVYTVEGALTTSLDLYRLTLNAAGENELASRALHSNQPIDGTLVYNNDEIFYQVGVRYRGSPWGRPGRKNRRVRFPRDKRFVRDRRGINLESKGLSPNEGVAYFMVGRHGTSENPVPASEYLYGGYVLNGGIQGVWGIIEPVGRPYVEKWYGADLADEALVLKGVGRFSFDDGCGMRAIDGATLIHKGDETEQYRGYWLPSIHRTRDDWDSFIELTRVMDWRHTPDELFDQQVGNVINVETFLRTLAVRMLLGGNDALFISAGHNGYVARDPSDGLWEYLAFDMDSSFNEVNSFFPGNPYMQRLLSRPQIRRIYMRILAETITSAGYWSTEQAGPFLDALEADTRIRTAPLKAIIERVAAQVREFSSAATDLELRVLNPGAPDGIPAEGDQLELAGEAPLGVVALLARVNGGPQAELELTWTSPTEWKATVPTLSESTAIELVGMDRFGEVLRSLSVRVVRGSASAEFVRGDATGDQNVNIVDVIRLLDFLFRDLDVTCVDALDVDDDGSVQLPDAIATLDFLFRDGPPPAPPFPLVGVDPTEDGLGCAATP